VSNEDEMDRLLMIPGPTPVDAKILSALAQPTISHTSAAIAEIVQECQRGLQQVAGTGTATPFVFAGSGTLAQEAAIVNLVSPGERLLVISNGFFGDRFAEIAAAHGINADTLKARWGTSVSAEQVGNKLREGDFSAITVTHVETSTGVAAPVSEIAAEARRHEVPVIVDAVCSLGGMPVSMDDWEVDIILSGAQKALGVPPGLALLLVSEAAMERRRSLGKIAAYYADLLNWESSMRDARIYFSTHAVNLAYALRTGLRIVLREGLEARFHRHRRSADAFRSGMKTYGFPPMTEEDYLAPTLSVLAYPTGIEDQAFRDRLAARGVVSAGCLGEFRGRGLRFGHMGNITEADLLRALLAVGRALRDGGAEARPEEALGAAAAVLG
jgi:alanine-glyoxylate transaminase/serine-glyoxylate transaminase/serine-pyruvate transaminase